MKHLLRYDRYRYRIHCLVPFHLPQHFLPLSPPDDINKIPHCRQGQVPAGAFLRRFERRPLIRSGQVLHWRDAALAPHHIHRVRQTGDAHGVARGGQRSALLPRAIAAGIPPGVIGPYVRQRLRPVCPADDQDLAGRLDRPGEHARRGQRRALAPFPAFRVELEHRGNRLRPVPPAKQIQTALEGRQGVGAARRGQRRSRLPYVAARVEDLHLVRRLAGRQLTARNVDLFPDQGRAHVADRRRFAGRRAPGIFLRIENRHGPTDALGGLPGDGVDAVLVDGGSQSASRFGQRGASLPARRQGGRVRVGRQAGGRSSTAHQEQPDQSSGGQDDQRKRRDDQPAEAPQPLPHGGETRWRLDADRNAIGLVDSLRRGPGRVRHQPLADGVQRRLGARHDADLGENVAQVHFDRVRADDELLSDLFVAGSRGHQPQDFPLALAEIHIVGHRLSICIIKHPRQRAPHPRPAASVFRL